MVLGVIGGIASGLLGASSARSAARAQERAAEEQVAFARETRDLTRQDLAPFYTPGIQANNALASIYGLDMPNMPGANVERYMISPESVTQQSQLVGGGRGEDTRMVDIITPATYGYRVGDREFASEADAQAFANQLRQTSTNYQSPVTAPWDLTLDDFEASPGYQFRLDQGLEAMQAGAAQRFGLNSGATQQALIDYGQGMASNEYQNFVNRNMNNFNALTGGLRGLASSGQNAAAGMGAANTTAGGQVINALGNQGNAQAAGYIGVSNALNQGFGNAYGDWQFNSLLDRMPASNTNAQPGGFLNALY